MNIYVGNLLRAAKEDEVRDLYSQYGDVTSVRIMVDKFTGQGRGFAFVEMGDDAQARAAIEATNGLEFLGRTLRVSEARPREERPRGGERTGGGDRGGFRSGSSDRGGARGGFGASAGPRRFDRNDRNDRW